MVRTGIAGLLCVFLFMGANWARWVLGVLAVLGIITAGIGLSNEALPSDVQVILIISLVFYAFSAIMLLNPKALEAHFHQR